MESCWRDVACDGGWDVFVQWRTIRDSDERIDGKEIASLFAARVSGKTNAAGYMLWLANGYGREG